MRRGVFFLMIATLLPGASLETTVQQLGALEAEQRRDAQQQLLSMAADKPRQTMVILAEAYAEAEELEIQARLESLLTDLAREWMFYHPPGFMGVNFRMIYVADDDKAVEVMQVIPGGAAEEAGVRANDRILEINGIDLGDMLDQEEFAEHIAAIRPGVHVELLVQRNDKQFRLHFPIGLRTLDLIDVAESSRKEEQKIRDWLSSLRGGGGQNPEEPLGHFQVLDSGK
jgi:hypothetical protein